jgi:hypothetical protein
MDELAGEFLAHATGHGFRLGLILQRCNNDGKPLLLTMVRGDNLELKEIELDNSEAQ